MPRSTSMTLVGGLDIGNGYVKGVIENQDLKSIDEIDILSGASLMTVGTKMPIMDENAATFVQGTGNLSIYNQLDASFDSSLIGDKHRRLFGQRGLSAPGSTFEQFDVESQRSKSDQELSKTLVLGLFAAKAVKDFVSSNNGIPADATEITADVVAVLALPIAEFMDHRQQYARSFTSSDHVVHIHQFETPLTVNLHFVGVDVLAEGASAQFAITDKGEPLAAGMLSDVRRYTDDYNDILPADVVAAQNTVGIDIGEGTVNFPIFTDGRFNPDASTTLNKGFGQVLALTLLDMEQSGDRAGFNSRKQLGSFLQTPPSSLKRKKYDRVKSYVDEQARLFSEEVTRHFGRVMTSGGIGAMTEVVYVYGGGASSLKDMLYPMLVEKVKEINGQDAPVILYLDSTYSRNLNREGLFIAARKLAPMFLKNSK